MKPLTSSFHSEAGEFPYPVLITDYSSCTEQDVQRILPLVGPERQQKALRYRFLKGQWACLKVCELLLDLWHLPAPLPDFTYNDYGKPYLEGMPDFSFSHCKNAIAVCTTGVPSAFSPSVHIGIDIESFRPVRSHLIERTMNKEEQAAIAAATRPDEMFIRLWTRKEALVKCLGTGIRADLKDILTGNEHVSLFTYTAPSGDYALSMAVQEKI